MKNNGTPCLETLPNGKRPWKNSLPTSARMNPSKMNLNMIPRNMFLNGWMTYPQGGNLQDIWAPPVKRAFTKTPGVKRKEQDFLMEPSRRRRRKMEQNRTPTSWSYLLPPHELLHSTSVQDACVAIEIDLPSDRDLKKKGWMRDFSSFLVNQVKKNHVEVLERYLTEEEKKLFVAAKDVKVKNFILAKVFECLPDHMMPDPSQVIRMRGVLTWKVNPETSAKKAKARVVVLGYLDPDYGRRPSASPSPALHDSSSSSAPQVLDSPLRRATPQERSCKDVGSLEKCFASLCRDLSSDGPTNRFSYQADPRRLWKPPSSGISPSMSISSVLASADSNQIPVFGACSERVGRLLAGLADMQNADCFLFGRTSHLRDLERHQADSDQVSMVRVGTKLLHSVQCEDRAAPYRRVQFEPTRIPERH